MERSKAPSKEANVFNGTRMTSTPKPSETVYATAPSMGDDVDGQLNSSSIPVIVSTMMEGNSSVTFDQATLNSTIAKEHEGFKNEFCSLNNRLGAYMQKVKTNEKKLEESEQARRGLEQHLEQLRNESSQQMSVLRTEVERRARQTIEAEEAIAQLEKKLESAKQDNNLLRNELEQKRQRETNLERMLVSEANTIRGLREENARICGQLEKEKTDRSNLSDQLTRLKVDNATLHERAKIATLERSMIESKLFEADKRLFTSEDVDKKLSAERNRLEKMGIERLKELQRKHEAEIEQLKNGHNKKLQDTLLTYVSAETYARLETLHQEALKRADDAEALVARTEQLLQEARTSLEQLKTTKNKELAAERRRRDKLTKQLVAQKQSYGDIRQELQTYRQLIESLDLDREVLANTPLAEKKQRTPLAAVKGRQVLLRKALTPRKTPRLNRIATPQKEPPMHSENNARSDCKVM